MTRRPIVNKQPGHRRILFVGSALLVTTALASCGGGDDDGGEPSPAPPPVAVSNQPPASASQSSDGFIAYLKTLVVTSPEATQPLDVAAFVAPVNDTGVPDPTI